MLWEPRQASPHATHPARQARLPAAPTALPRALHPFPPRAPGGTGARTVPRLCWPRACLQPGRGCTEQPPPAERGSGDGTGPPAGLWHCEQSLDKAAGERTQGAGAAGDVATVHACYRLRDLVCSAGCWHWSTEEPGEKDLSGEHGGHGMLHRAPALLLITGEGAPAAHPRPLSRRCRGGSGGEPQGAGMAGGC